MPERVTRSQVYGTFREFCKAASRVCREDISEEDRNTDAAAGAWYLEYEPGEGYRIEAIYPVITPDPSFQEEAFALPFGSKYRPGKEMICTMQFAANILRIMRLEQRMERRQAVMEKMAKDFFPGGIKY